MQADRHAREQAARKGGIALQQIEYRLALDQQQVRLAERLGKDRWGLSMNITASPKLWLGPRISTTFSLPADDEKASLICPRSRRRNPVAHRPLKQQLALGDRLHAGRFEQHRALALGQLAE